MNNKNLTLKEFFFFDNNNSEQKFGIFVFGKLHDTLSNELTADASANNLRSIHPEWKIEVHPIDENGNIITDQSQISENRMVELMKSFEKKNEIIKEKTKTVNVDKLEEEKKRLKEVAKLDEANQMNYWVGNVPMNMGTNTINTAFDPKRLPPGQTINTMFSNNSSVTNQSFNPHSNKPYNPNYSYLQPAEATRLAISRTLNSGAPVNDLGFYEEVNRELNILGFNAKSPLDIKQAILSMIKD